MAPIAPATVPFGQNFLEQPKHNHHVQIMVLVIVLGIVIVCAWLYAVLSSPSEINITVTPPMPKPISTVEQVYSLINHPPTTQLTAQQISSMSAKLTASPKTTASASDKQAILNTFNSNSSSN